jgi:rhodanese-related sulfurtransferase
MPERVDVTRVLELLDAGAKLVEVLPEHEYREQHLPGAIGLPLKDLTASTASRLASDRPVIVYCWDSI